MKHYKEDEYLLLSGIQHFVFCQRQWALIHLEQQWEENYRTVDGNIMHKHAHDDTFHEKRGDVIITRGMAVSSPVLGVSGECDVVEFHKDDSGVEIYGQKGRFSVIPIEYKRGKPKTDSSDVMQLAAQAMCLEDMLCCEIPFGFLYYGETKHRLKVEFSEELRLKTCQTIERMHDLYYRGHTPKVKRTKSCNACSLKNICLPAICGTLSASEYMHRHLDEEDDYEEIT